MEKENLSNRYLQSDWMPIKTVYSRQTLHYSPKEPRKNYKLKKKTNLQLLEEYLGDLSNLGMLVVFLSI